MATGSDRGAADRAEVRVFPSKRMIEFRGDARYGSICLTANTPRDFLRVCCVAMAQHIAMVGKKESGDEWRGIGQKDVREILGVDCKLKPKSLEKTWYQYRGNPRSSQFTYKEPGKAPFGRADRVGKASHLFVVRNGLLLLGTTDENHRTYTYWPVSFPEGIRSHRGMAKELAQLYGFPVDGLSELFQTPSDPSPSPSSECLPLLASHARHLHEWLAGPRLRGLGLPKGSAEPYVPRHLLVAAQPSGEDGHPAGTAALGGMAPGRGERIAQSQDAILGCLGDSTRADKLCLAAGAGAGKTTLLERLAFDLAGSLLSSPDGKAARVPFLLKLREWQPGRHRTLVGFVRSQYHRFTVDLLDELCRSGRAVLLLDGLDEVPLRHCDRFQEWLNREVAHEAVSRCPIILAGRPEAFNWSLLGQFRAGHLGIEILTGSEIKSYIQGYFGDNPQRGLELAAQVGHLGGACQLLRQPLFLRLACSVWAEEGMTPSASEAGLLERSLRSLLGARGLPEEASLRVLSCLAWAAWESGSGEVCGPRAAKLLAWAMRKDPVVRSAWRGVAVDRALGRLASRSGILARSGTAYRFAESIHTEYLAGRHLAELGSEPIAKIYAEHVWDPRWSRVLEFMMAQLWEDRRAMAGRLVRWLLEEARSGHDDMWHSLVFRAAGFLATCGEQKSEEERALVREVAERVVDAWRSTIRDAGRAIKWQYAEASLLKLLPVAFERVLQALMDGLEDAELGPSAARLLAIVATGEAVAALRRILRQGAMAGVREAAVVALVRAETGDDLDALVGALHDESEPIRRLAIEALAKHSDPRAVAALAEALRDETFRPKAAIADAVGVWKPDDPRTANIADALIAVASGEGGAGRIDRATAAEALGKLRIRQAVGPLVKAVGGPLEEQDDFDFLDSAVGALAEIGSKEAQKALFRLAGDAETRRRQAAVAVLRRMGGEAAEKQLTKALADKDDLVRHEAARGLTASGFSQAVGALRKAIADPDVHVRCSAARALGASGSEHSVDALVGAIGDDCCEVSRLAGLGLVRVLRADRAIDRLAAILAGDGDIRIRRNVPQVLAWLGAEFSVQEVADEYDGPRCELGVLRRLVADRGVDALIAALRSDADAGIRRQSAAALKHLPACRAVKHLIAALRDPEWQVRAVAADAMEKVAPRRAVGPLLAALGDPYPGVRRAAAHALGRQGHDAVAETGPALSLALSDGDDGVIAAAADALDHIGCTAMEERLCEILVDGSEHFGAKCCAAAALGAMGSKGSVAALIRALRNRDEKHNDIRWQAAVALGKLRAHEAEDSLLRALDDSYGLALKAAITALGQIGSEKAVDRLVGFLNHDRPGVRGAAAEALGIIGSERAVEGLLGLLGDSDFVGFAEHLVTVGDKAAAALKRIDSRQTLVRLMDDLVPGDRRRAGAACFGLRAIKPKGVEQALLVVVGDFRGWAMGLLSEICEEQGMTIFPSGRMARPADLHLNDETAPLARA